MPSCPLVSISHGGDKGDDGHVHWMCLFFQTPDLLLSVWGASVLLGCPGALHKPEECVCSGSDGRGSTWIPKTPRGWCLCAGAQCRQQGALACWNSWHWGVRVSPALHTAASWDQDSSQGDFPFLSLFFSLRHGTGRAQGAGRARGTDREQDGHSHGAGRAPHGSTNHSPHLLCLEALPGASPVPSMPMVTPAQGWKSGAHGGHNSLSYFAGHCARPAESFWAQGIFHSLRDGSPAPAWVCWALGVNVVCCLSHFTLR